METEIIKNYTRNENVLPKLGGQVKALIAQLGLFRRAFY